MKQLKSDLFTPLSIKKLLDWIFTEEKTGSIFGIDRKLFFDPIGSQLEIKRFDTKLETPIGVAAGPHTQLAQNIVCSWLTGARYIELKTVQNLDELDVTKPCIDMNDEGYNCEWSQELRIEESYKEYLKAWIIIFILKDRFEHNMKDHGFIFNMSIGYDYEGILKDKVQWFLSKMKDCSIEKAEMIEDISGIYPCIKAINIPDTISDNITLSTMHGCPSNEIEKIGSYLIKEKYHTTIKLNPTLLGSEKLRNILNKTLNFDIKVPDIAFQHDLKYNEAIQIISNLKREAESEEVFFGIKLTNTLETENVLKVLPENEKMHYLSGRALHPISINLARALHSDFKGELDISFCGGVDAFNISDVIACGLMPVTVSSDLLKPGGYGRLFQYIENIRSVNTVEGALKTGNKLNEYSMAVLNDERYKKTYIKRKDIKTDRSLNIFDCTAAPCMSNCGTDQDIPGYMYYTSIGNNYEALKIILDKNPLPLITGTVCTQLCTLKCTRINYDSPLAIRNVKKSISEATNSLSFEKAKEFPNKISVIGAGPSGLSCAYYLTKAGLKVDVYEKNKKPGGMISYAIPSFRLSDSDIDKDFDKIVKSGINVIYDKKVNKNEFKDLLGKNEFVYLSTGAPLSKKLKIKGENAIGVYDPLDLLFKIKKKEKLEFGKNVVIIGGGNTAMDIARSIRRLVSDSGTVTVLYRRRISDMPADEYEIKEVVKEGILIKELVSPLEIYVKDGRVSGIKLENMRVSGIDKSGRGSVSRIPDSVFEMKIDSIIPAIGQDVDDDFIDNEILNNKKVLIGGDAKRGASSIINGVGDGRKAAMEILDKLGIDTRSLNSTVRFKDHSFSDLMLRRSKRIWPESSSELNNSDKLNFDYIQDEMSIEDAKKEASRCLYCDELCNICVTVCPNRANISCPVEPFEIELEKIVYDNGKLNIKGREHFAIIQKYQVLNISDFCNECGNCNTFCPTNGAPYKEKPKICLTEKSFKSEKKGYFISKTKGIKTIKFKNNNTIETLLSLEDHYSYETEYLKIKLSKNNFRITGFDLNKTISGSTIFSLKNALIMKIILENYSCGSIPY